MEGEEPVVAMVAREQRVVEGAGCWGVEEEVASFPLEVAEDLNKQRVDVPLLKFRGSPAGSAFTFIHQQCLFLLCDHMNLKSLYGRIVQS